MRWTAACLGLAVTLAACGDDHDRPGPAPDSAGDEAEASDDELYIAGIELPPLPHGVRTDRAPLEHGVALAVRSGETARPELPEDASLADVQRWVEGPLHDWMLERGRGLREARALLAEAEEEDAEDGERAVAAAVIGVLYLTFAVELSDMPMPASVRADAAARLGIRNALLRAASPLYDGALSAFGACIHAAVSSTDPSLEPWERFCDDNGVEAQEAPRPIDDGTIEARSEASETDETSAPEDADGERAPD